MRLTEDTTFHCLEARNVRLGQKPRSRITRKNSALPVSAVLLTSRQMEVLEEIRHGKANKQIAYELNMSEHTVKVHLRDIMRKLKARNRTEVAVLSEALIASPKN
jgi:DNA-binding NarL/FixJ family response regulator